MLTSKFKGILLLFLYSLIFLGIGYLIAIPISAKSNYSLQDVMFFEGIASIVIGLMLSMKGNPSGISLQALGRKDAQYISNENLEAAKMERASTNYYKNFLKHSIIEFTHSSLVLVIGGIFLILLSVF